MGKQSDIVFALSRELKRLKQLEGTLCFDGQALWLLPSPQAPTAPQALVDQLNSPTPCPTTIATLTRSEAPLKLTSTRLATWSHALKRLGDGATIKALISTGEPKLRQWRHADIDAALSASKQRYQALNALYQQLITRASTTSVESATPPLLAPLHSPPPMPAALQHVTPHDAWLWAQLGRVIVRIEALYGVEAAEEAWRMALAIPNQQLKHERAQQRRALVFEETCKLLDKLTKPAATKEHMPPQLRTLTDLTLDRRATPRKLAQAFMSYVLNQRREPEQVSARMLTHALLTQRPKTWRQAATICLSHLSAPPRQLTPEILKHLATSLYLPGQLQAPKQPLKDVDVTLELAAIIQDIQRPDLWPYCDVKHAHYAYKKLLHASPPAALVLRLSPHMARLRELMPLFGRWSQLEQALKLTQDLRLDGLTNEHLTQLVALLTRAQPYALHAALLFVQQLPSADAQARWQTIINALESIPKLAHELSSWFAPAHPISLPAQLKALEHAMTQEQRQLCQRYLHHRQQCGHGHTLSANIQAGLDRELRQQRELAWLEQTLFSSADDLTPARRDSLLARLNALKQQTLDPNISIHNACKQLQRALDKLEPQSLNQRLSDALLKSLNLPNDTTQPALPTEHLYRLIFIMALDQAPAPIFIKAALNGQARDTLPHNQAWLKHASQTKLNVSAFLEGFDQQLSIEGQPLRIHTEQDLWQRVMMGDVVHTCLALTSFNAPSALINALDLNKHVIYVRDAQGHIIARKLIGLDHELRLIGYETYFVSPAPQEWRQQAIKAHINEACAALARRANTQLVDCGAAAQLHPGDLYDDGAHPWHHTETALPEHWPHDKEAIDELCLEHGERELSWRSDLYLHQRCIQLRRGQRLEQLDAAPLATTLPIPLTQAYMPKDLDSLGELSALLTPAHQPSLIKQLKHALRHGKLRCDNLHLPPLDLGTTAQALSLLSQILDQHRRRCHEAQCASALITPLLWALAKDHDTRTITRGLGRPQRESAHQLCTWVAHTRFLPGALRQLERLNPQHINPNNKETLQRAKLRQAELSHAPSVSTRQQQLLATPPEKLTLEHYDLLAQALHDPTTTEQDRYAAYELMTIQPFEHITAHHSANLPLGLLPQLQLTQEALIKLIKKQGTYPEPLKLITLCAQLRLPELDLPEILAPITRHGDKGLSTHIAMAAQREPELVVHILTCMFNGDLDHNNSWIFETLSDLSHLAEPELWRPFASALAQQLNDLCAKSLRESFAPEQLQQYSVKLLEALIEAAPAHLSAKTLNIILERLQKEPNHPRSCWLKSHLEQQTAVFEAKRSGTLALA